MRDCSACDDNKMAPMQARAVSIGHNQTQKGASNSLDTHTHVRAHTGQVKRMESHKRTC